MTDADNCRSVSNQSANCQSANCQSVSNQRANDVVVTFNPSKVNPGVRFPLGAYSSIIYYLLQCKLYINTPLCVLQ